MKYKALSLLGIGAAVAAAAADFENGPLPDVGHEAGRLAHTIGAGSTQATFLGNVDYINPVPASPVVNRVERSVRGVNGVYEPYPHNPLVMHGVLWGIPGSTSQTYETVFQTFRGPRYTVTFPGVHRSLSPKSPALSNMSS